MNSSSSACIVRALPGDFVLRRSQFLVMRVILGLLFASWSPLTTLGIRRKLYLLKQVTDFANLLLELARLLFGLLFKSVDLVVGLVPVLVGVVGLLDDVSHLLALFLQLAL